MTSNPHGSHRLDAITDRLLLSHRTGRTRRTSERVSRPVRGPEPPIHRRASVPIVYPVRSRSTRSSPAMTVAPVATPEGTGWFGRYDATDHEPSSTEEGWTPVPVDSGADLSALAGPLGPPVSDGYRKRRGGERFGRSEEGDRRQPRGTVSALDGSKAHTVKTGQFAVRTTLSATLPMCGVSDSSSPCFPITIRSASICSA